MKIAGQILFCFLVVFNCSIHSVFAGGKSDAFELTLGYGKMIRNYPDFPTLESPAIVGSLKFSREFSGYKPWHRYYNNPNCGLNFTAGSLGNKAVLGSFAGLMAEIEFEKKLNAKFFWSPRMAFGGAWFSNPYNEFQNPENIVIGSEFTFLASAEVILGYAITNKTDVLFKFGIVHASNSHFKLPNVGMNVPVLSVGTRFHLSRSAVTPLDSIKPVWNEKIQIHARVALGVNESGSSISPVNGPKSPIYLGSVYVAKLYSPINKVSVGIEAWYNKGVYDYIVSQEFYDTKQKQKSMAIAAVVGHEFLMAHFGLLTTVGLYLYNPFYKDRLRKNEISGFKDQMKAYIPARLGIQYYLKNTFYNQRNNLFVGIYIKTNFGQADFLESGVGYMF